MKSALAMAITCAGCWMITAPPRTVRYEDLAAWHGAPTVELQTHNFFSTVPKSVERLADGSELWTYSNCHTTPVDCRQAGGGVNCDGGNPTCCHNQFLVRGPVVEWYRANGNCWTDCHLRPPSRACGAPAAAAAR